MPVQLLILTGATSMPTISEIETRYKIAEARLQVAEELRIPMASLAALLTYAYSNSILISIAVVFGVMLLVPYWYTKEYNAASDEYDKATATGKYYRLKGTDDT